jgi:hypothetical protein
VWDGPGLGFFIRRWYSLIGARDPGFFGSGTRDGGFLSQSLTGRCNLMTEKW